MNVTVGDPAGCSNRFPVQFFSHLNLILNAYLLMYTDLLINKNNYESHFVMFHMQSTYLLKLTVRLRMQFVSVSPLNVRLSQTRSLGLKVWGAQNIFRGSRFLFLSYFLIQNFFGKTKFGGACICVLLDAIGGLRILRKSTENLR